MTNTIDKKMARDRGARVARMDWPKLSQSPSRMARNWYPYKAQEEERDAFMRGYAEEAARLEQGRQSPLKYT